MANFEYMIPQKRLSYKSLMDGYSCRVAGRQKWLGRFYKSTAPFFHKSKSRWFVVWILFAVDLSWSTDPNGWEWDRRNFITSILLAALRFSSFSHGFFLENDLIPCIVPFHLRLLLSLLAFQNPALLRFSEGFSGFILWKLVPLQC